MFVNKKFNYRDEEYLDSSNRLHIRLEETSASLFNSLVNNSYRVFKLAKIGRSGFNEVMIKAGYKPNSSNEHSKNDFKGIYIFGSKRYDGKFDVLYIGISQTIRRIFFAHVNGKGKNFASWAYMMAKTEYNKSRGFSFKKFKPLPKKTVDKEIKKQQNKIQRYYFSFYPIEDCHTFMYLAEPFCVSKLCSTWNSFETH